MRTLSKAWLWVYIKSELLKNKNEACEHNGFWIGSVYIEAEGYPDAIAEFVKWCRKGFGCITYAQFLNDVLPVGINRIYAYE